MQHKLERFPPQTSSRSTVTDSSQIDHWGSTGRQKHFLWTAYHQIWPPLTYVEVKCYFTAEIVG